jgi:hypothetical protein
MKNEMTDAEIKKIEDEKAEKHFQEVKAKEKLKEDTNTVQAPTQPNKIDQTELAQLKNERDNFLALMDDKNSDFTKVFKSDYLIGALEAVVDPDIKDKRNYVIRQMTQLGMDYDRNKDLRACSKDSILKGLRKILSLGLRYGIEHKEGVLVKGLNKSTGKWEAQFRDMYMAYVNKVHDDMGWIVQVNLVCKEEIKDGLFEYDKMSNTVVKHSWSTNLKTKIYTRDNIVGAYVLCKNKKGEKVHTSQLFTVEELYERAKQVKKDGTVYWGNVWGSKNRTTDFAEMVKKSAIRLWAKTLPKGKTRNIFDTSNEDSNVVYMDTMEVMKPVKRTRNYDNADNSGL